MFTPAVGRDAPYNQTILLKVSNSAKPKEIRCRGKGLTPKIQFRPASVNCGPILPKFEGQAPNRALLQLYNPCDFPVQVSMSISSCPLYLTVVGAITV